MNKRDGFTLPGESGYETLTLELARRWGADVIRDSDGTQLSPEILDAGYGIYSTICIIRDHNNWAKNHLDTRQQTFLMTEPLTATSDILVIDLMADFFKDQFAINDHLSAMKYWQVYDRTTGLEVSRDQWTYDRQSGKVQLCNIDPWHRYTVSFLAYRLWEEISMYNHTTNNWDKEHLMPIDPMYDEVQDYLVNWMDQWCRKHPETTVVRFTSMFYNFVWMWGSSDRNRHRFTDWGSYDFTVSDRALDLFEKKYGYQMTAEDFVNGGKFHVSHIPSNDRKKDWMSFINDFVIRYGKKLIDIVHQYNMKAYVFYDDSWVGVEPTNDRFQEFGFDGLIKCVFSGYESRLCSSVDVPVHELRLHPYLFPVGLGGAPTFKEGGNPTLDAKQYWLSIRRALLREPVDRIGLGGYLHLVEPYPDFVDYIEKISDEFRTIRDLHQEGAPYVIPSKVAVLHSWGKLRSWTLSGHFHETYMHDLIHINEALSGLPVDVSFIDFDDVESGKLENFDVVINAGYAGSAWSGGDHWNNNIVVSSLTKWVHDGGIYIGVKDPSALSGHDTFFRMAHILGVDKDNGERVCHGKWTYDLYESLLVYEGLTFQGNKDIFLTDGKAKVLVESNGAPALTLNTFGKGIGFYLSDFTHTPDHTRLLFNLIRYGSSHWETSLYMTDNVLTECAYYPGSNTLIVINNSNSKQTTSIQTERGLKTFTIDAFDTLMTPLT